MNDLIIAGLATYRLALLISEDDGPFKVFSRFREWAISKSDEEQRLIVNGAGYEYSALDRYEVKSVISKCEETNLFCLKWATLAEGLHCPYCVGMYMAILTFFMSNTRSKLAQNLLKVLAIAGLQSAVRTWATR